MSHFFTGTTGIQDVLPSDTPNEGRVKINENFDLIEDVFGDAIHGLLSGSSRVYGDLNINVVSGSTLGIPEYTVSLDGSVVLTGVTSEFISGSTISGDTYYIGNTPLLDYLTGDTAVFTTGSTGSFSIRALNDTAVDATGDYAYAEGYDNLASGIASHAEGGYNGKFSDPTSATTNSAHSEGVGTLASGNYSHAEGQTTRATGTGSHSEGFITTASGSYSHAEGGFSIASNT